MIRVVWVKEDSDAVMVFGSSDHSTGLPQGEELVPDDTSGLVQSSRYYASIRLLTF
jgi:hypothetical protein